MTRLPGMLSFLLVPAILSPAIALADSPSWKEVRTEFLKRFRERNEFDRSYAVLGLADGVHPEAVEALLLVLERRPSPAVYAFGVSALSRLGTPECLERIRPGYEKASPAVRAALLLALRACGDSDLREVKRRALSAKDIRVRTAAVASLAEKKGEGVAGILSAAISDAAWPVAAAAVDRIEELGLKESATGLPALLESPSGRLRHDALRALKGITGKDFGLDRELWERWLAEGKAGAADDAAYATPTFYGIRVVGSCPVFVLDISASMLEPVVHPAGAARGPVTGEGADGPPRIDWSKIRSKLDLAKAELVAVLEELPEDSRFGLVFYSDSVAAWQAEPVPATPKNIAAAVARVKGLGASGNTNIYGALLRALDLDDKDGALSADPGGVDQVLFLTDGRANRGAVTEMRIMRTTFRVLYWLRRVRLDCVGVGDHDKRLLQGLAKDCRGLYVEVGR